MPEIKIHINTVYDGQGAKDAEKDKEKLERPAPGGKSSLATPPPNINAPQPPSRQEAAAQRRETTARNRQIIADAEEDLARAKAKGASSNVIADLDSQLREQKLKARFMREQGLPEEDAVAKAQNLVALQNEARARKSSGTSVTLQNRQSIAEAEQALEKARATGASANTVAGLESHLREQKLKARFMREQGLPEEEALRKARDLVEFQNRARERKQAAREEGEEAKRAAKATQDEEKKALKENSAEKKQQQKEAEDGERKQLTVAKARASFLRQAGGVGIGLAAQSDGGIGAVSQLGGTLMQLGKAGGPIGEIVAMIATGVAATVASFQERGHNERLRSLENFSNQAEANYSFRRAGGFEGSASGSRNAAASYREQLAGLIAGQPKFEEEIATRWYNPTTWNIGGSQDRKRAEYQDKINLAKEMEAKYTQQASEMARETTLHEISRQKKMAGGDMAGARAEQNYMAAYNYYRQLREANATDQEAREGTEAFGQNLGREQAGKVAGLVTARDGAGDTAAVAREAMAVRQQSMAAVADAINKASDRAERHHSEAMGAVTQHKFSRP